MKILITGATGTIGRSLGKKLITEGHSVRVVSRSQKKALENLPFPAEVIECDLMQQELPTKAFVGIDVVVNLLGETIDGRWSQKKKTEILNSRKISSENLLKNLPETVKTIVTASAQGFYGDRGDELLTENSTAGAGFLAEVCLAWESLFQIKRPQRIVILRLSMVLTAQAGALKKLVSLFQKNLGAVLGSGKQWMSWVSLIDATNIFFEAIINSKYEGVINASQPIPVQNKEFTASLCESLGAFQLPAVPSFVLKMALGEMSSLVLSSQKVLPEQLQKLKFQFQHQDLQKYLQEELQLFKEGVQVLTTEQFIAAPLKDVFNYFSDAHNLEKITPDMLRFKIKKMSTEKIEKGTLIDYKLKIHGVPASWKTLIEEWNPPFSFVDHQLEGPYSLWHHTHSFREFAGGTLMRDEVQFKLPMGFAGKLVAGSFVESDVGQIFEYRRHVIANHKF